MTNERLNADELVRLVERVFAPHEGDRDLAILVDLPDRATPDVPAWKARRLMAAEWFDALSGAGEQLGRGVQLWLYRNVRANNADLPDTAWRHGGGPLPPDADSLDPNAARPMSELWDGCTIALAPTQFSATAPLKNGARARGFRAATMPGFSADMIPALRIDYVEVNRRVMRLKEELDRAEAAEIAFTVDGEEDHSLYLDLRHRQAHPSGGVLHESGTAGNLPSGETYIVPYEGELDGIPSRTAGIMPVQLGEDVVLYTIDHNRAIRAEGDGDTALAEARRLAAEPAYGNLSELGLGVLDDFGVRPVGVILLDEKLAPHIAFGRSDHFGGQVGPAQFSRPEAVIHIDRVYLPELQPRVLMRRLDLVGPDGVVPLIRDGRYVYEF